MARMWHRLVPAWLKRAVQSREAPAQAPSDSDSITASPEAAASSIRSQREFPAQPRPAPAPVVVNLGIDFGTAFTKICYRDSALEESGVVTFGASVTSEAMIPAVVSVTEEGDLLIGETESPCERIEYLKMRLA